MDAQSTARCSRKVHTFHNVWVCRSGTLCLRKLVDFDQDRNRRRPSEQHRLSRREARQVSVLYSASLGRLEFIVGHSSNDFDVEPLVPMVRL